MSRRRSKKAVKPPKTPDPGPRLRKAPARRTKSELIDALVEFARADRAAFRRLADHFELETPPKELIVATRQAIADATAFDEREINYNFRYDYEAYDPVQKNLRRLIERGQLRPAMKLSLELMAEGSYQVEMSDKGLMAEGSYQVEMSDEGLMTDDIEACFRPVLKALRVCDLPAADLITWYAEMLKADRVGFICDQEFRVLRQQFEPSRPS